MRKFLRQSIVIARRDFVAIVFTPTFLIFLFAPLLMLGFGAIGGLGATQLVEGGASRNRIVVIADTADSRAIAAIDGRLRKLYRREEGPPALETRAPQHDPATQARALFTDDDIDAVAVLYGPLDRPTILQRPMAERSGSYLAELAEQALRDRSAKTATRLSHPDFSEYRHQGATESGRQAAGFGVLFGIFFLTLLLAGQSVGMLAEERNNKVIEILAAAVPLEAVFLGKMLGMFGVALLFVGFWGALIAAGAVLLPGDGGALASLTPAVGLGAFALLALAYFAMAFLLLGAVFLGIGAQASTMREIQMLSLPITMFQVGMFALSAAAAGSPGSTLAAIAQVFPFSSPFAMAARAGTDPALWPHFAALAWQALWVAITIVIAARLFRQGVLKSGGSPLRWLRFGRRRANAGSDHS